MAIHAVTQLPSEHPEPDLGAPNPATPELPGDGRKTELERRLTTITSAFAAQEQRSKEAISRMQAELDRTRERNVLLERQASSAEEYRRIAEEDRETRESGITELRDAAQQTERALNQLRGAHERLAGRLHEAREEIASIEGGVAVLARARGDLEREFGTPITYPPVITNAVDLTPSAALLREVGLLKNALDALRARGHADQRERQILALRLERQAQSEQMGLVRSESRVRDLLQEKRTVEVQLTAMRAENAALQAQLNHARWLLGRWGYRIVAKSYRTLDRLPWLVRMMRRTMDLMRGSRPR